MSRFIILLGGKLVRTPRLDAQVAGARVIAADAGMGHAKTLGITPELGARVIAADAGMGHAKTLGITPELWVGDFDSVSEDIAAEYAHVPQDRYPEDKDNTDGELAVAEALRRGATSLVLAGAFGGRADHAFLHTALAIRRAKEGLPVLITSGNQEAHPLLPGARDFDYDDGTIFSILGFSHLSGVTVMGARWPLDSVEIPFGTSLPLSNEVRGDLRISIGVGRAVLLAHPYPDEHY